MKITINDSIEILEVVTLTIAHPSKRSEFEIYVTDDGTIQIHKKPYLVNPDESDLQVKRLYDNIINID